MADRLRGRVEGPRCHGSPVVWRGGCPSYLVPPPPETRLVRVSHASHFYCFFYQHLRPSAVLAVWAVEDEEVALVAVALVLLVDEGQIPFGEDVPPLVERDVLELTAALVGAALKVEPQDARTAVIAARRRCRLRVAAVRPILYDFARASREGRAVVIARAARLVDPLRSFGRVRELVAVLLEPLLVVGLLCLRGHVSPPCSRGCQLSAVRAGPDVLGCLVVRHGNIRVIGVAAQVVEQRLDLGI